MDKNTMKPTEYLYGVDATVFKDLPYHKALQVKKELAVKLLHELLNETLNNRDLARITAVYSAVQFNTDLLTEIGF